MNRTIFSALLVLLLLAISAIAGAGYTEEAERVSTIAGQMKGADCLSNDPMDMSEKQIEGILQDVEYYRNRYGSDSVTLKIKIIPDDETLPEEYIFGVYKEDFEKVSFPTTGRRLCLIVAPDSRNHGRSIYSGNPYPYGWDLKAVETENRINKMTD